VSVRPSAQGAAERCGYVSVLAREFPETNENIERGNAVDGQAGREMAGGPKATDEDARACVTVARNILGDAPWKLRVQEKVVLRDPDTGEEMGPGGTPDMQAIGESGLITFDWKKREQWFNGYLAHPNENLQLDYYSLATCLDLGLPRYRNILVLFGDGKAEAQVSEAFEADDWWPKIERIRAIQTRDETASPGPHCQGCWQRWVCKHYHARAQMAVALMPDGTKEIGPLTDEQAGELASRALAVKAAVELALDLVKAHHRNGGAVVAGGKRYAPSMMPGKRTADLKLIEREGLTRFIKQGEPYERWIWKKEAGR
jgi:hypothetical protein